MVVAAALLAAIVARAAQLYEGAADVREVGVAAGLAQLELSRH